MTLKEFAKQISEAAEVSPDAEVVVWDDGNLTHHGKYMLAKIYPGIMAAKKYGDGYSLSRNGETSLCIIDWRV